MSDEHVEFPRGVDMIPQSSGNVAPTDPGHEMEDVRLRGIIIFLVVLIVLVLVFQILLGGMMSYFSAQEKRVAVLRPDLFDDETGQYAGPELQDSPNRDKPEIMRAWYAHLDSYGWTDPSKKVARIPIERAISLLAERGIEKVPPNPLPYDVGQPEDPNAPATTPAPAQPEAEPAPAPAQPKTKTKTETKTETPEPVEATPAPDPKQPEN